MRKPTPAALFAAPLFVAAGTTLAADQISAADCSFLPNAAAGGLAEVQDAQMAQRKSASNDIKHFAELMITDHTQANTELMQIAKGKGITPPSSPTQAQENLKKMSGGAFDSQYMQQQVEDHQNTVTLFQTEANSGQDAQLKAYAQKYLPKLQQHLQVAQSLAVKAA